MYVYVRTDWYVRGVPLSVCALLLMIIEPASQSFTASAHSGPRLRLIHRQVAVGLAL